MAGLVAPSVHSLPDEVMREAGRASAEVLVDAGVTPEAILRASCLDLASDNNSALLALRMNALYVGLIEGLERFKQSDRRRIDTWRRGFVAEWQLNLAQQQAHGTEPKPPGEPSLALQDRFFDETRIGEEEARPPSGTAPDTAAYQAALSRLLGKLDGIQIAGSVDTTDLRQEVDRLVQGQITQAEADAKLANALSDVTSNVVQLLSSSRAQFDAWREAELTDKLCLDLKRARSKQDLKAKVDCDRGPYGTPTTRIDIEANKAFALGEWEPTSQASTFFGYLRVALDDLAREIEARRSATRMLVKVSGSTSEPSLRCECLASRLSLITDKAEAVRYACPAGKTASAPLGKPTWDNELLSTNYPSNSGYVNRTCKLHENANGILADYRAMRVAAHLSSTSPALKVVFASSEGEAGGGQPFQRVNLLIGPSAQ